MKDLVMNKGLVSKLVTLAGLPDVYIQESTLVDGSTEYNLNLLEYAPEWLRLRITLNSQAQIKEWLHILLNGCGRFDAEQQLEEMYAELFQSGGRPVDMHSDWLAVVAWQNRIEEAYRQLYYLRLMVARMENLSVDTVATQDVTDVILGEIHDCFSSFKDGEDGTYDVTFEGNNDYSVTTNAVYPDTTVGEFLTECAYTLSSFNAENEFIRLMPQLINDTYKYGPEDTMEYLREDAEQFVRHAKKLRMLSGYLEYVKEFRMLSEWNHDV